jgi:pimeloyl-ACP methyl ester carboxylesterase
MTVTSHMDCIGGHDGYPGDASPTPFEIKVDQSVLDDLQARLESIRWPNVAPVDGWAQGVEIGYLRSLMEYWRRGFDWRAQEDRLNRLAQFTTTIDGTLIHFIHIRGRGPNPLPLVLTHGWPSSVNEFSGIIPLLTDPEAHGGDASDSFDVIIPSLPGYGFSRAGQGQPMTTTAIAALWVELMTKRLGYPRFCAHGGDIGAGVTNRLGLNHADVLHGIHVMAVLPPWLGEGSRPLTSRERGYQQTLAAWEKEEGAYQHLQNTRPQTLSYAMHDSPVGMAAWITEKLRNWSDCRGDIENRFSKDDVLTGLMLYWATESFASSVRLYYNAMHFSPAIGPEAVVTAPTAVALTTEECDLAPPEWAERRYTHIRQWTEFPRGGHFMAHEEPGLLAEDLRIFFRPFRDVTNGRLIPARQTPVPRR